MTVSRMNGTPDSNTPPTFRPLSSKATLPTRRRGPNNKSHHVAPKQAESPIKASSRIGKGGRLRKVTASPTGNVASASTIPGLFARHAKRSVGQCDPICISSDDGKPDSSPPVSDRRISPSAARFLASRFIDREADCSSDSDTVHTQDVQEEEALTPGFIVSDGHLSSDEDDDWDAVQFARRIGTQSSSKPKRLRLSKEAEKEQQSPPMEWSPCGQPPSPPMSPINIEDDTPLCRSEQSLPEVEDISEPGELVVEVPGKKFRFQSQFVLLTYKSHLPKDDYTKWFKEMIPTTKFLRLAHEAPDRDPLKCPYRHTHVVADLGLRPNYYDVHKFCYKNPELPADKVDKCGRIHCHIKRLPGTTGLADAKAYIGKEDRANADLLEEQVNKGTRLVERIQQAPSLNAALKQNLKRLGDAAGIMAIYGCRPAMTTTVRIPDRPDKPWQVELLQEVEDKDCPPMDRKIIWYVDKRGNTGKSWFSRYLSRAKVHEDGTYDWLCMSGINDDKEAAHQLVEAKNSGFTQRGFIMDLARSFQFCEKFYKTLEDFKNGEVTSYKYRGGRIHMNTPWLVVFANFWPKVKKMSLDRWDIRRINVDTEVAEHLPFDAEAPEEVPWNRVPMPDHILQERV